MLYKQWTPSRDELSTPRSFPRIGMHGSPRRLYLNEVEVHRASARVIFCLVYLAQARV